MKVAIRAKLNITLAVGEVIDGYHNLHSSVATVNIADVVSVSMRQDDTVVVNRVLDIDPTSNNAYKTAVLFQRAFGTLGCDIVIDKGIPPMSGLGGSSADSAAVLFCLCALNGIDTNNPTVLDIAAKVGSDVTYLLHGGDAIMTGKGDDIVWQQFCQRYFVVTTFAQQLDTASVFGMWDALKDSDKAIARDYDNNLQYVVERNYDFMEDYISYCNNASLLPRMTGSGSGYFVQLDSWDNAVAVAQTLQDAGFDSMPCHSCQDSIDIIES